MTGGRELAQADAALAVGLVVWGLAVILGDAPRTGSPGPGACEFPVALGASEIPSLEVGCGRIPPEDAPALGSRVLLFGLPLEINAVGALALESLPGIGPVRARRIVEARCVRSFRGLDSLARVSGIGPRTVAGLQGWAVARASPKCPLG
ncbi:MAG: helix-hairpin-helix domain-containing protein [Myxococcota bacterium]|nr:helix-hairpin-helix domain-containing protein [Myxococcota bacterium]